MGDAPIDVAAALRGDTAASQSPSVDPRVRRLRRGVLLTMLAIGAGEFLTGLVAFTIPFVGGNGGWLDWVQLIPLVASVGCWVGAGVIRAAARAAPEGVVQASSAITVLRIAAIVMVATRLIFLLALFGLAAESVLCVWGLRDSADLVFAVTLLAHLRAVARCMGMVGSARVCGVAVWAAGVLLGGSLVMALLDVSPGAGFARWGFLAVTIGNSLPHDVAYVVIIAALIVFARRLPDSAAGRCAMCGYSLAGLSTAVCPECGIEFQGHPIEVPPVR